MATLILIGQACVIDAEALENSCLQVVYVNRTLRNVVTVVVRFSHHDPGLDSPAGHPHREAAGMVIAPIIFGGQTTLAVDRSAKFAAPHHQRLVQQTTLLQIRHEGG